MDVDGTVLYSFKQKPKMTHLTTPANQRCYLTGRPK
jgi:hypothetical protein